MLWLPCGGRRRPGTIEICKQYSTLGPSASKLTNRPSLWAPGFRIRSNVGHFWAFDHPPPPKVADRTTLWGPRGGRRQPGTIEFCKQYSTLGPSASNFANSPSLWAPGFRSQRTCAYFWALRPRIRRQYHTLGSLWGPAEAGDHRNLQTVQHFGPLGFKICKQSSTLAPRISKSPPWAVHVGLR